MIEEDFKDAHSATLLAARRFVEVLQVFVLEDRYMVGLAGSVLVKGAGRDVDLLVIANDQEADTSAVVLATEIAAKFAHQIRHFEHVEYEGCSDVYAIFVTSGNLYVDMHVKGPA